MRRARILLSLTLGLIAVGLWACSDDTSPAVDGPRPKDSRRPGLEPSTPDVGTVDAAPPREAGGAPCTPFKATSNSGKSCTGDPTVCPAGEFCFGPLKTSEGVVTAMCLGKCCRDLKKAWDDPANLCPVPNASTQMSGCDIVPKDKSQTPMVCGWWCEWKDENGKLVIKSCPTEADYDCVALFPDDPDSKYCVPKK